MYRPRRIKRILSSGALLLAVVLSIALVTRWARDRSLLELSAGVGAQLKLQALSLQRLVDRYRVLPSTLALNEELRAALEKPRSHVDTDSLSRKLARINGATHISTLTLIDAAGIAIAASNWREPSSNVGYNYTFRPYYQRAMKTGATTFYAIGVTTHEPGYFIARAIENEAGRRIGVIVVKVNLREIVHDWDTDPDTIVLSDHHGIVFLTNRRAWQYRPLHKLTAQIRARLERTRQYTHHLQTPARTRLEQDLKGGGRLIYIDFPGKPRSVLVRRLALPAQGWTIHAFSNTRAVTAAMWHAGLATLGGWLLVIMLGLFLRQRSHLAVVRQHSREELERLVAHYASALRSEQDSLVQAALQAIDGNRDKLDQLPQGVSVVDAQLRLVAWNRRYEEIFRFPEQLMQIGRPIKDLIRYNAERGLLGPGDMQQAIRRRLDYLRAGSPHMYERERPDGTVLEIRGNPLPNGGFVTSYADISAYKKAARALRTLTGTLEHRIEESTRKLRAAKTEAEQANHDKTRYVAAAVHDLLQPLNAARLYSGALHKVLDRPRDRDMLERVEQALHALDRQFGSMLDLSRLEAGAIKPKMEDVELAPLLQSLARQFGIIAQANGLSLHLVNTRAWVRSDAMLLRRMVQNFLSNALHYTRRGKVLLGCRCHGDQVRIEVWDTGVGIPEDKQDTIFREFARLDTGLDTDERSTGLGLSIVKRLANLLGHSLMLHSWPGHGSVFAVGLPRVATPESRPNKVATDKDSSRGDVDSPLAGRHVLCVDDDDTSTDALATLLRSWSCIPHVAHDATAVRRLAGQHVDIILLGYRLGATSGLELLPTLHSKWCDRLPVIMLVSETTAETRQQVCAANLRMLVKPISPARLRALMSQLLVATSPG